jgi:hypothetical protein
VAHQARLTTPRCPAIDELNDAKSQTETFVAINQTRTGATVFPPSRKAAQGQALEIVITFHDVPYPILPGCRYEAKRLYKDTDNFFVTK